MKLHDNENLQDMDYTELDNCRKQLSYTIDYLRRNASKMVIESGNVTAEEYTEALKQYVTKRDYITTIMRQKFGSHNRFKSLIKESRNLK